tara:strand:+ start:151 stop:519 length:369 start_codon:yes stop_codon:yes gene_type:complete
MNSHILGKKYLILIYDRWLIITIALLFLILFLSLHPFNTSSNLAGNDKFHHLIAYAALSFPSSLKKPPHYISICLFFILFGGIIELAQPYFDRYQEFSDFLTNAVGVILGMILGSVIRKNNF